MVDLVIFDTPPVLAVTDPVVLASRVDGVVVVLDADATPVEALRRTREALGRAAATVLGVVLNKITPRSGGYYYHYYRGAYHGARSDDGSGQGGGTGPAPGRELLGSPSPAAA